MTKPHTIQKIIEVPEITNVEQIKHNKKNLVYVQTNGNHLKGVQIINFIETFFKP